jgi:ribosomal protein S18 acetylase RimI-like enzyme
LLGGVTDAVAPNCIYQSKAQNSRRVDACLSTVSWLSGSNSRGAGTQAALDYLARMNMVDVVEAQHQDAAAIAAIHLTARQQAMPYLRLAHTNVETRDYFARVVANRPQEWWVVRHQGQVVAYMLIDGESLNHLYVAPDWQGRGLGSALLVKAKTLSPRRLVLWTFQRNQRARAFYESRGFRRMAQTDGDNEENEPDVQYEWRNAT